MAKLSRSALFYRSHPKSREAKKKDDAKINKRPDQVAKRVALNKFNRQHKGKHGAVKGDELDAIHKGNRIVGYADQRVNRGDTNDAKGDLNSRGKKRRK